jgi:hypothetical protein
MCLVYFVGSSLFSAEFGFRTAPLGALLTCRHGIPPKTAKHPKSSENALQIKGISSSTSGTRRGITGEPPSIRRRRGQNAAARIQWQGSAPEAGVVPQGNCMGRALADAAVGGGFWISVADQKRGFEGGLWYQGMSRVCPGCPRTTPREARKARCIRDAYGERRTLNLEPRTSSPELRTSNGRAKPPKATSKPPQSVLVARG